MANNIKFYGWEHTSLKNKFQLKEFAKKYCKMEEKSDCYGLITSEKKLETNYAILHVATVAKFNAKNNTCTKENKFIITNNNNEIILIYPEFGVGSKENPINICSQELIFGNENRLNELTDEEVKAIEPLISFATSLKKDQKER